MSTLVTARSEDDRLNTVNVRRETGPTVSQDTDPRDEFGQPRRTDGLGVRSLRFPEYLRECAGQFRKACPVAEVFFIAQVRLTFRQPHQPALKGDPGCREGGDVGGVRPGQRCGGPPAQLVRGWHGGRDRFGEPHAKDESGLGSPGGNAINHVPIASGCEDPKRATSIPPAAGGCSVARADPILRQPVDDLAWQAPVFRQGSLDVLSLGALR